MAALKDSGDQYRSISFLIGRKWGRMSRAAKFSTIGMLTAGAFITWGAWQWKVVLPERAASKARAEAAARGQEAQRRLAEKREVERKRDAEAARNAVIAKCTVGIEGVLAEARKILADGDANMASVTLYQCHGLATNAAWQSLANKIETIRAAKAEQLIREEKARKRNAGVSIGMSKEDVLASSWGKPEKINTTTTAYGTREQWVYGGHNYLYFTGNVLATIQN